MIRLNLIVPRLFTATPPSIAGPREVCATSGGMKPLLAPPSFSLGHTLTARLAMTSPALLLSGCTGREIVAAMIAGAVTLATGVAMFVVHMRREHDHYFPIICASLRERPKTTREIAEELGFSDSGKARWILTTMELDGVVRGEVREIRAPADFAQITGKDKYPVTYWHLTGNQGPRRRVPLRELRALLPQFGS